MESRSGGTAGDFQIVVTFNSPVTVGSVAVTSGTGSVVMANGNGTDTITVDLTGVVGRISHPYARLPQRWGKPGRRPRGPHLRLCDVNASGAVNSTDVSIVKAVAGQAVSASNFRADVIRNGEINASDSAR